MARITMGRG